MRGRRARAAVLLGALCLVALAAAEVVLRVAYLGSAGALLGAWQRPAAWAEIRTLDAGGAPWPRPHGSARWALQPWSEPIEYRLDGRGLRVADAGAPAHAAAAACRVLVAGDSNAFGYGVAAADALPARLGAALAGSGVRAQVANGGICASNVALQRRWLEAELPGLAPDVLVLVVSPWSLRVDHAPAERDGTTGEKLWNVIARPLRRASRVSAAVDRAQRRLGHALHDAIGWPPPGAVAWELEPLVEPRAAFAARLRAAADELTGVAELARGQGAEPLLVFVPLDVQVSRTRNRLYLEEALPYPAYGFADLDYTRDRRYRALGGVARAIDAPLVDASGVLRAQGADAYLADDYHLSAAGHERVARAVAPAVARACERAAERPAAGALVARDGIVR